MRPYFIYHFVLFQTFAAQTLVIMEEYVLFSMEKPLASALMDTLEITANKVRKSSIVKLINTIK